MITVYLSDERMELKKPVSLAELLAQKNIANQGYAIAINHQFVPNAKYAETMLNENDRVDIIIPMQGG